MNNTQKLALSIGISVALIGVVTLPTLEVLGIFSLSQTLLGTLAASLSLIQLALISATFIVIPTLIITAIATFSLAHNMNNHTPEKKECIEDFIAKLRCIEPGVGEISSLAFKNKDNNITLCTRQQFKKWLKNEIDSNSSVLQNVNAAREVHIKIFVPRNQLKESLEEVKIIQDAKITHLTSVKVGDKEYNANPPSGFVEYYFPQETNNDDTVDIDITYTPSSQGL